MCPSEFTTYLGRHLIGCSAQIRTRLTCHSGRWDRSLRSLRFKSHADVAVEQRLRLGGPALEVDRRQRTSHSGPDVDTAQGDVMKSAVPRPAVELAPLWSPAFEHDSCGVGLVVDIAGRPSHDIVERA